MRLREHFHRLFGHESEPLPERVQEAIRAQQNRSEKLIGWIQLTIVLLFGLLYAIAPKTFDASAMFAPVPYALASYLAFTVLRIYLAHQGDLKPWFVALSAAVDVALLLGLIWSFHIQYAQPAPFYLKAPTMLYLFIFITLRGLRFEAQYVLWAGTVAVVGWLAMVTYAIYDANGMDAITRDYVAYLTSNTVLLGGEMDKLLAITMVTVILALAISRARRLLESAVREETAARELSRFFDPEVAHRIAHADHRLHPGQGVLRNATIISVDLRGFTRLSQTIAPDALIGLLTEYQSRVVPAVNRHHGTIDKFMGDGLIASFGAAQDSDSYAADALRAACDILAAIDGWNTARRAAGDAPVGIGVALASGPVVFGAIGDESRLDYTVIGEAVNRASKLEKHTKAAGCRALADARTHGLAKAQGFSARLDGRPLPGEQVSGLDGRLDLYGFDAPAGALSAKGGR